MRGTQTTRRARPHRAGRDRWASDGKHARVLSLDSAGLPVRWLDWKDAVTHCLVGDVLWSLGETSAVILGGTNRLGERSRLELPPIIALRGEDASGLLGTQTLLTPNALFARDRMLCLYCGTRHSRGELTRDHVRPLSRGGLDVWENVVTACKRCNNRKAARTPEEAGMPLLGVPYAPNHAEGLILRGQRILADQMEFLLAQVPKSRAGRYTKD
ncbi:MAG: HNH endonuclease [Acidiferrobacterales bacterium]